MWLRRNSEGLGIIEAVGNHFFKDGFWLPTALIYGEERFFEQLRAGWELDLMFSEERTWFAFSLEAELA
jgi:hypothetical protein